MNWSCASVRNRTEEYSLSAVFMSNCQRQRRGNHACFTTTRTEHAWSFARHEPLSFRLSLWTKCLQMSWIRNKSDLNLTISLSLSRHWRAIRFLRLKRHLRMIFITRMCSFVTRSAQFYESFYCTCLVTCSCRVISWNSATPPSHDVCRNQDKPPEDDATRNKETVVFDVSRLRKSKYIMFVKGNELRK